MTDRPGLFPTFFLALLIGLSRVMLGVHWPSDVLGGWTLGLLWILLCVAFLRRDRTAA